MRLKRLTASELNQRRAELTQLAEAWGGTNPEEEPRRARYAPDTPEGRQLYESFSDQELLALLREMARRLGRSPAQGEVFWVYRLYIRTRFKNWPSALRSAGLSRAAGKCGKPLAQTVQEETALQAALSRVREQATLLGRMPHPSDLPEVCTVMKKRYQTWGEVLMAAGALDATAKTVYRIPDLEVPYTDMLAQVRRTAEALNRAPLRKETDPQVRAALIGRCGSWRNALYQIGLEPVTRISPFANSGLRSAGEPPRAKHRGTLYDCYYRLLSLDDRTRAELTLVERSTRQLGRPPGRHELPGEVRRHLQDVCGSWSNALYQLGLHTKPTPNNHATS